MGESIARSAETNKTETGKASGLDALNQQIEIHKKHDRTESFLSCALGFVTTLNNRSDRSLAEMQALKAKAEAQIKDGGAESLARTKTEIDQRVKEDRDRLGWKAELARYGGGLLKTAALFSRSRLGLAGTLLFYGADQARMGDDWKTNLVDGALGGLKGGGMRLTFSQADRFAVSPVAKGFALSSANSFLDATLSRGTWQNSSTGRFSPESALGNMISRMDLQMALVDGLMFSVAHKLSGGGRVTADGGMAANRLFNSMKTGGIFGMVTGGQGEFVRQWHSPEGLDPMKILTRAALQGGFDALGAGAGHASSDKASVSDAYYEARWALRDGKTEARQMTYSVLNQLGMRHPLQRLGDFVFQSHEVLNVPRPKLTAGNNPVEAFERELPKYYRQIEAKEQILDGLKGYKEKGEIYEQQKEIRREFAFKLLNLWNGTSKQPGISSFTDAELATSNVSRERVSQIRRALTLTAQGEYPSPSPMTKALADLARFDLRGREDSFGLLGEIASAKEKFYRYDERDITLRMAMPAEVHWKDHNYGTPVDWMPFEANAQLANLFHGTVSNSLPAMFRERVMLSAREMRLRGIAQTTGESANEEFPRRAVSLTREFSEAWAYHRHSPAYLTGFPVIFGASKDVVSRAHPAGLLEPGEILIDKLRLGSSFLTRLGLRKQEITHMYVPDGEVNFVNRLLSAHRIKDVRVVGLNELATPNWKPIPELTQGEQY